MNFSFITSLSFQTSDLWSFVFSSSLPVFLSSFNHRRRTCYLSGYPYSVNIWLKQRLIPSFISSPVPVINHQFILFQLLFFFTVVSKKNTSVSISASRCSFYLMEDSTGVDDLSIYLFIYLCFNFFQSISIYNVYLMINKSIPLNKEINKPTSLVSLFNGITTFMGYLMPKQSL